MIREVAPLKPVRQPTVGLSLLQPPEGCSLRSGSSCIRMHACKLAETLWVENGRAIVHSSQQLSSYVNVNKQHLEIYV